MAAGVLALRLTLVIFSYSTLALCQCQLMLQQQLRAYGSIPHSVLLVLDHLAPTDTALRRTLICAVFMSTTWLHVFPCVLSRGLGAFVLLPATLAGCCLAELSAQPAGAACGWQQHQQPSRAAGSQEPATAAVWTAATCRVQ